MMMIQSIFKSEKKSTIINLKHLMKKELKKLGINQIIELSLLSLNT